MTDTGSLTVRQRRFVAALIEGPNVREAAKVAGIGERTAWRYLRNEAIRRELAGHHDVVMADTSHRMAKAMAEAVDVVLEILRDAKTPPAVRVSAGRVILDSGLRLAELVSLAERVAQLEARAAMTETAGQNWAMTRQLSENLAKFCGEQGGRQ